MAEFPVAVFRLDGEPAAIRASAVRWFAFGTQAVDAAAGIRSLDTSLFVGPEGDRYREGLSDHLPPHLDVTGQAHLKVASALSTYAGELESLQDRLAPLAVRAPALWDDLRAAHGDLVTAQLADMANARRVLDERADVPGEHPAPPTSYEPQSGAASAALATAQQLWDDCLSAAQRIKTELRVAIDACTAAIREAEEMRFTANPHGIGRLMAGVTTFVKDHAAGLAKLSGGLKLLSAAFGVLSFVPVVNVVAAPLALATGAAAVGIDASIKVETGQGSWTSIGIDAGLMVLPGVGKLAGDAAKETKAVKGATAFTKSYVSDVKALRVSVGLTTEGVPMAAVEGKTAGQMLTDAKAAASDARVEHSAHSGGLDLTTHEQAGGHTLARHVGAGDQALMARNIPYASIH